MLKELKGQIPYMAEEEDGRRLSETNQLSNWRGEHVILCPEH